jgi:hypothetical protein
MAYAGVTSPAPGGGWMITWDTQRLSALPTYAHDYIFYHECAHASVPTTDEVIANCRGLVAMRRDGRSSRAIEEMLGRFHASLGWMGAQYGNGYGADYWQRTLQCAGGVITPPRNMSTRCRFTYGFRAGQVQDYAPRPPIPVGTPCNDGRGSFGFVIP